MMSQRNYNLDVLRCLAPFLSSLVAALTRPRYKRLLLVLTLLGCTFTMGFPFGDAMGASKGFSLIWFVVLFFFGGYFQRFPVRMCARSAFFAALGVSVAAMLLVLVYLSPWNPTIPTMRSIFFFCLGAWLGTFKLNMLSLCRKVRIPALIAAAILLPLAASQVGRPLHLLLLRLFYPCGMIVFMLFVDALIDNEKRRQWLCGMAGCVFFIYAAHEIYILSWTKGLMLRIFGDSLAGTWASFWLVPPVVLLVCIALYHLLNRIMPRTLAFASGGRSKKE